MDEIHQITSKARDTGKQSILYTYMSQRVNIEEAIQSGVLGEAKDIAPGATLQELMSEN